MTKRTYKQRMMSYIILTILTGAFLTLSTGYMRLAQHHNSATAAATAQETPYLECMDARVKTIEPMEFIILTVNFKTAEEIETKEVEADQESDLVEYTQDRGYDGEIVVATAREVITMQIDDNGVKHFTNHLLMVG